MASKEEIKLLFIAELKNTPQYQIILNIKQLILDEISRPNIQKLIIYIFDRYVNSEEQEIIKMCGLLEFGFDIYVNESMCEISMDKFLL